MQDSIFLGGRPRTVDPTLEEGMIDADVSEMVGEGTKGRWACGGVSVSWWDKRGGGAARYWSLAHAEVYIAGWMAGDPLPACLPACLPVCLSVCPSATMATAGPGDPRG